MKLKTFLPLIASMIIGATINIGQKEFIKAEAARPMPTNINMNNSTDSEVSNYYAGVNGKVGDALLGFLYTKIKDHNEYDYENDTHRFIYKIIDRNWELDAFDPLHKANTSNFNYSSDNGFIRKLYADYNDDINTADRFKNADASRVSFDKEHIWAQSLGNFGRTGGAGSDFHSLWPSDVKGNQQGHSNYSFGVPTSNIKEIENDKGGYVGRNGNIPGYPNKVFEPLDQYKGDIARAMFYMPARYYEYIDALHPKLELVNSSPAATTASSTVTGKAGVLNTLLEWHELDPVDDYEIRRNNLIANNYQMNRNPFIDYPQWARIAYDPSYTGSGASNAPETSSVGSEGGNTTEATLLSISLVTTNVKTAYYVGETFTTNGLIVNGHFDDDVTRRLYNFTTSITEGTTLLTIGNETITVSASHNATIVTASYDISISSVPVKELTSISISGNPDTLKLKSTFDSSVISVTAHYSDGDSVDVTSDATIRTPNTALLGTQLLRVDYSENSVTKTATYEVRITNQEVSVGDPASYATDLFFSEYVEGSSNNKYIEIYNGTGQTVDLSDYEVQLFANANTTPTGRQTLSGILNHDDVIVLKHSSAALTLPEGVEAITSSANNFNGNDALVLKKLSTGDSVDIFGKVGENPATAWTGGGVTTVDRTLVRKPTVKSGVMTEPTSFNPSLEWIQYPIDTATYLGSHDMDNSSDNISPLEQAEAYATFFLNETGPYCDEGEANLLASDGTWTLLSEEYGYMHIDTKLIYKNSAIDASGNDIEHTKARYLLLINRYNALRANNFLVDNNNAPIFSVNKNILPPPSINRHFGLLFASFLGLTLMFPIIRKKIKKE